MTTAQTDAATVLAQVGMQHRQAVDPMVTELLQLRQTNAELATQNRSLAKAHEVMSNVAILNNYYREAHEERELGERCLAVPLLCHLPDSLADQSERPSDAEGGKTWDAAFDSISRMRVKANIDMVTKHPERRTSNEEWKAQADTLQRQLIDKHGEVASTLIDSFEEKGTAVGRDRMATSQGLINEAKAYGPKKRQLKFEERKFHRAHQLGRQEQAMTEMMVPTSGGAFAR